MEVKIKEKALEELQRIVGAEFVSNASADLYIYSQDMTENEPHWPDFVVMPESVAHVQEILRLANRERIPVTLFVAGANIGGLTIPLKGGISLDLKRMNRVVDVNEIEMYAVLEPGVTFGHLKAYLTKNHPQLTYSYPLAPPYTSVMCNALLMGMGDLGVRYGIASDMINGLEVVLPTGEVVKVGSCAVSDSWFGRAPLPDVAGLFIGWQGATGVVTKIAVQLWPRPKYVQAANITTYDMGATFRFTRRIVRMRILDEIFINPYDTMKVLVARNTGPFQRLPGEPEFVVMTALSANSENELKAKLALRDEVIKEEFRDSKVEVTPWEQTDYPLRGHIEVPGPGGLTWVGTYGPPSRWEEAMAKAYKIMDKYGFPRIVFIRPLREGHFSMFRPIVPFNKANAEEIERVRQCMGELTAMALEMGFVPYKAPDWSVKMMAQRADPNWVELLRRVKKVLDPNDIMNPGRWGAPAE